jgi:hypothetical protein
LDGYLQNGKIYLEQIQKKKEIEETKRKIVTEISDSDKLTKKMIKSIV